MEIVFFSMLLFICQSGASYERRNENKKKYGKVLKQNKIKRIKIHKDQTLFTEHVQWDVQEKWQVEKHKKVERSKTK